MSMVYFDARTPPLGGWAVWLTRVALVLCAVGGALAVQCLEPVTISAPLEHLLLCLGSSLLLLGFLFGVPANLALLRQVQRVGRDLSGREWLLVVPSCLITFVALAMVMNWAGHLLMQGY
ncbi:hypothetical protein [Ferrimonas gelatinilytica]|uniref:Uncharacterized protein n=1 Tax=Ferrimonas gelatinilytica TaxID=1255257 RepID=A0ABP9SHX4_9GAMM